MNTFTLLVFTVATGIAVVYVHRTLPRLVARPKPLWLARSVLTGVGGLFAAVMLWRLAEVQTARAQEVLTGLPAALVFASAFGLTHVPAAVILFLKQLARRQSS